MLLPYKLSKILKLKRHLKWRLISIIKIICSFGKVDQNIKIKNANKSTLIYYHIPFSCGRINPFPWSLETRLKVNESTMSQNYISKSLRFLKITAKYWILNTKYWISSHKYFIPKYLQNALIDCKGPDLNYFGRKVGRNFM